MDAFYLIMAILLGFSLVYVLIKNQLINVMNEKLHFLYKEKIEADIQNIYREFESYSAIIDSRINRLKLLTERQESNIKTWENIQNEIKKSKTGKEVLKYIETQGNQKNITADDLENVKKQITDELKTYLALKLKLDRDKPQTIKTREPAPPINVSRAKTAPDIPPIKNEEFNVAELIVNDLVEDRFFKPNPLTNPRPSQKPSAFAPKVQDNYSVKKNTEPENKFIKTLASIGKSLSPLFLKSEIPDVAPEINMAQTKKADFNELIRKEAGMQARKTAFAAEPETFKREISRETVSVKTNLAPDELVGLIESLRNSKSRPAALKNLLGKGFDLNQIAELSSIPYSDLELTKNLYRIQP